MDIAPSIGDIVLQQSTAGKPGIKDDGGRNDYNSIGRAQREAHSSEVNNRVENGRVISIEGRARRISCGGACKIRVREGGRAIELPAEGI